MDAIRYPQEIAPEPGQLQEIADGVFWLRMPLPMALDHINLYLLDDGDGWVAIDSGLNLPETREHWRSIYESYCREKPIKKVLCTHMHPDHIGSAGWLCETFQAPLYMSQLEYFTGRSYFAWLAEDGVGPDGQAREFMARAGLDAEYIEGAAGRHRFFTRFVSPLPNSYRRLRNNERLQIGEREFQIITSGGHSPEHVSLFAEETPLLLSGDQIIARISSNVSVSSTEPEANPLAEWLEGLRGFLDLPEDTLVLPSHNLPFYGVRTRVRQLIDHHQSKLQLLREHCTQPYSALELLSVMFERDISRNELGMAVGETLAHLHYLIERGEMQRRLSPQGVYEFMAV